MHIIFKRVSKLKNNNPKEFKYFLLTKLKSIRLYKYLILRRNCK